MAVKQISEKTIKLTYHYAFTLLTAAFMLFGVITLANIGIKTFTIGNNLRIDYAQTSSPTENLSQRIEEQSKEFSPTEKELLLNWALSYNSDKSTQSPINTGESTRNEIIKSLTTILVAYPIYWYHQRKIRNLLTD